MSKLYNLLILSAGLCWAGTPFPTTPATGRIASGSLGNQSMRWEMRLIGVNWAATTNFSYMVQVGGFGVQYLGGTSNPADLFTTSPDNVSIPSPSVDWTSDMLVRLTRDVTNMLFTIEVYDTHTGAQLASSNGAITSLASSSAIKSLGISIGNVNATGSLGFLRWYSSIVPIGTAIPVGVSTPADLGDWEFKNNPNDQSGNGQTISGISSYITSPVYSPACSAGTAQTVTVGSTLLLNGSNSYPLDGGTTLTYSWSVIAGTASLSSATIQSPMATGLPGFGPEDFQLTVTDSSGNSSTCSIHDGVVIADTNGVIDLTAEGLDTTSQKLIGPLIAYGENPWPWADTVQTTTLTGQLNNLANYYTPYWRTPLSGHVRMTAGSNIVTTSDGADLLAVCGGSGSTPLNDAWLIWQYSGTDSLTHYAAATVASCTDSTHIVLNLEYPTSPNTPWPNCSSACTFAWQWGYSDSTPGTYSPQYQWGVWTYGAAPGNYYDNAKSFYSMYWRTGIDTYLTAFQNLADEWWEFPSMDQGYGCYSGISPYDQNNDTCWAPGQWRSMALTGVVLRALEQGPTSTKWAGLRVVWELAEYVIGSLLPVSAPYGIDDRENGYAMGALAYCALADPDSGQRSTCQSYLKGSLAAVWTPNQRPDLGNAWGNFNFDGYYQTQATSITHLINMSNVSACVINGSTAVTGANTTWVSGLSTTSPSGGPIWFFTGNPSNIPPSNAAGDSQYYNMTVNSPTSITLSTPYAGTTGCTGVSGTNKGFVIGYPQGNPNEGFVGWGIQPYSLGHIAQAFFLSADAMLGYDAPSRALFQQYGDAAVQAVINYGINNESELGVLQGGLYDAVFMVGCAPPVLTSNIPCYTAGSAPADHRVLALELVRAFAEDYRTFGNPIVRDTLNTLMSQMFSKPGTGGPTSDPNYLSQFDPGQIDVSGYPPGGEIPSTYLGGMPKWTGQACGYTEACDMWPAVLAGSSPIVIIGKPGLNTLGTVKTAGRTAIH